MLTNLENFVLLDRKIPNELNYSVARDHAPLILFDQNEPFLPSAVGYTVFWADAASPSFPREIHLAEGVAVVIEYAIWWDWDIQHLYELEHIWLHLDADGTVVDAEASWHGGMNRMVDARGALPLREGRLVLHSEPGKHAFAPVIDWLLERRPTTEASCGPKCGIGGVLVTDLFQGKIKQRRPLNNQLAHSYLETKRFTPSFVFEQEFNLRAAPLVIWESLRQWIPARVTWWTQELARSIPYSERRVLRIAHRGASAQAVENSRAAFERAAALGADLVEVDLRLTADSVPVISHDESLKRVYGLDVSIGDLSLEALCAQVEILTFADLVALCRELGLGLYLDIKALNREAAQQIFAALDEHGMTGAVVFSSFRADWLAEIKAQRPQVWTSILFSSLHVDPVLIAQAVGADYVHPCWEHSADQPHTLLTEDWLARVREADLGIITWHEERPDEIAALKRLGVNGICSDQPELLL